MRRWGFDRGFTYLGLLILVAIIGLVGAAGLKVKSLLQRAAAEEELLEIGAQFSQALKSYAEATPRGHPRFPATLAELLRDPRFPGVRRHLRKVFVDPVTGRAEWGIVYLGENAGVLGVYSLSDAQPLKIANFDARFINFENKKKISDWKFMLPGQSLVPGTTQGAGALPSLFGPRPASQPGAAPTSQPVTPALVPSPPVPPPPVPPPLVPPPSPADPEPPPPPAEPTPEENSSQDDKTEPARDEKEEAADKDESKEEKPDADGRAR